MASTIEIFFCYAREDELLRKGLEKQLQALKRQGLISLWHDREINAGMEWESEINKHLNTAQIILLLVSPDFMDSDYCYGIEMIRALERHERGEARIIPIILRPVYWQEALFSKLQVLPTDAKPITDPDWHNLDRAFFNVAEGIRKVAEEFITKHSGNQLSTHAQAIEEHPIPSHSFLTITPPKIQKPKPTDLVPSQEQENFAQMRTLIGHSQVIWTLAISSDDQILASGSADNTIRLWNLHTGQLIRTLGGHSNTVLSVIISSDDQILASGSADNTIRLWNLHTGQLIRTLSGHLESIYSLAISSDDQILASGSADGTIRLWNLYTEQLIRTLGGHLESIYSLAISSDDQILASGSADGTIRLWNLHTGQLIRTLGGHLGSIYSLAISSDDQILASGSADGIIRLWNLHTGQLIRTLKKNSGYVRSVTISPDSQILVSGGDTKIKLWNLHTGQMIQSLKGHKNEIWAITTSSDGQILASGSADNTIKIWYKK